VESLTLSSTDPLFSQDALVVVGDKLLTVNAGSNTVAYFRISRDDPLHPELVGTPVSSGGTVPNAIAYSKRLRTACVTNTGATAGVQCFAVTHDAISPIGSLMPLPIKQTNMPLGPPNTVSDVVFNPDDTALFVTVKGDGMNPGYIYAYPVMDGKVSATPVVSRPPGLLLDFSMTFISDCRAVISDPAYGASYVSVARDFTVSVEKKIVVPGQKATCWTAYSDAFNSVYLFDGGNVNVTTLDPVSGSTNFVIEGSTVGKGSFDAVVHGGFLYVLQGSPGIAVFSLVGNRKDGQIPKLVQFLDLSHLGARAGWTGLSAYP
jgi:hypothetical protein